MKANITYCVNRNQTKPRADKASTEFMSASVIGDVRNFHRTVPGYAVTPLHSLSSLAQAMRVRQILIKDESQRFGLNAFKALGGSFAIARYICNKLGMDVRQADLALLTSPAVKKRLGDITFVTATDGNHGRGVAWAATMLGMKAVVYMPRGSAETRLESIRAEGAEAFITELNYDDTVRMASRQAAEQDWILVQDTAWDGYEEIPTWIMQGYGVIVDEILEQMQEAGYGLPSHVFLQAGVGSFAAAVAGGLAQRVGLAQPIIVIVEPDNAACLYKSIRHNDGQPHGVSGSMETIMAGLSCGEPSTVAWDVLRDYAHCFFSCPDYVAAHGMRLLAEPISTDPQIVSGESGAVGIGLLSLIMADKNPQTAAALQLNTDSKILFISTEGDTDQENYKKIICDGAYMVPDCFDITAEEDL